MVKLTMSYLLVEREVAKSADFAGGLEYLYLILRTCQPLKSGPCGCNPCRGKSDSGVTLRPRP